MRTCTIALLIPAVAQLTAQPGMLDPSFSGDGKQTTDVGLATFDEAYALAIQADGAIIVAGTSGYSGTQDFAAVRYLGDGTPDPAFGSGGKALVSVEPGDDIARAMAVQADGRIVLGGYSYTGLGIGFAMVRLNADGTADASFGTGGIVTTVTPGDATLQARSLAIQPDNRILLAGGGAFGFAIMRYTTNGDPDSTFGGDGLVTVDFSDGSDQATAMALLPDDRILVVGYAAGLVEDSIAMARLMPDGSLDPGFGAGGKQRVAYPTLPSIGLGTDLLPDGRFVVCGYANSSSIIGRFNANGTSDTSFNLFGWRLLSFAGTVGSKLYGVHVQADDRIALGGIGYGATPNFLVVNLNYDGSFDTGFGTGGYTLTDFNALIDDGFALAAQTDGRLVLAGRTDGGVNDLDFAIARYMPDLTVAVGGSVGSARSLEVFPVPLGSHVTVSYTLPAADRIGMQLIDPQGRVVHMIMKGVLRGAGSQREVLAVPASLTCGAYILRVYGGRIDERMVLVR